MKAARAKSEARSLLNSSALGSKEGNKLPGACAAPPPTPTGALLGGRGRHRASPGPPGLGLHLTGTPQEQGVGSDGGGPGGGSLPPLPLSAVSLDDSAPAGPGAWTRTCTAVRGSFDPDPTHLVRALGNCASAGCV